MKREHKIPRFERKTNVGSKKLIYIKNLHENNKS